MNSSMDQAESKTDSGCGFSTHLDILRELPFFTGISLDVMKVLAYLSANESFSAGDMICAQGEHLDRCYYVKCGEVDILRQVNGEHVQTGSSGPGFFFGGLALLSPVASLYSVRAATDVECLVLDREKFGKTVERFPEILPKALQAVVAHIFRWEERFLTSHAEECVGRGDEEFGLSLF